MSDSKRLSRRRFLTTAGGGIAAATLFAACGSDTPATTTGTAATAAPGAAAPTAAADAAAGAPTVAANAPAPAAGGEVVLLIRPDIKGAYGAEVAVADWAKQFPTKITLDEVPQGADSATKIQSAQAADDLAWSGYAVMETPWATKQYVNRGLIQPLDDYIKSSTVPDAAKVVPAIIPTILESSKFEGKQYSIPGNVGSIALAWQAETFKAAGIADQPTTWDEVYEAAKKIKATKPDLTPFDVAASPLTDLYPMIWGGQENPFNADGLVDITGDVAVEALQWMQKMVKEGLMPGVHKDSFGNWLKGGTAMILSYDVAGTIYEKTFGAGTAPTGTSLFKEKGKTQAGVPFWMNAMVVLDKAKNAQGMTDFYLWWVGPSNKASGKQFTEVAAKPCYQYTYDEFVKTTPAQAWQLGGIDLVRNSKGFNVDISATTQMAPTQAWIEKALDPAQNLDAKAALTSALEDVKAEVAKQK